MTVLTANEYEELRPYRDIINFFMQYGQIVNTAGNPTIFRIFLRINPNETINQRCGDCVHRVYHLINEYLKDYENGKGS